MKLSKKLIATMLALMLLVTIVPMPAHAASKATPSKVTVTQLVSKKCNTVTVKWKPSSKKNIDGYYVYCRYKTAKGWSKWVRIKTLDKTKTSFTHKASSKYPIKPGTKYQYAVRAYNKRSGTKSPYTAKAVTTHKHSYTVVSKTAPTCTKDGKTVKKCKWCEAKHTETVKKPGHNWVYHTEGQDGGFAWTDPEHPELGGYGHAECWVTYRECTRCHKFEWVN